MISTLMNLRSSITSRALLMMLFLAASNTYAETYYFHTDHLGTPQLVTDGSQQVAWHAEYDPFGEATETISTVEQNLRLPGQYFDQETGLHYNYFRNYDPTLGRYTQSDPVGLLAGLNTYLYGKNAPILNIDNFGLAELSPISAMRTAIQRGDIETLEMLMEFMPHNLTPSQQSSMRQQCIENLDSLKSETLDRNADDKQLYNSLKRMENVEKGNPVPRTRWQKFSEFVRSVIRLF